MTDLVDRLFVISVSNRFSLEISSKLASSPFNHPPFISIFHRACRIGRVRYSVLTLSEEAKHIESRRLFSRSDTSPAASKKFPLPKNRWDVRSTSFKLNRTKIELYFSIPIIFVFRELWSSLRSAQLSHLTGPTTTISREPIPEEISRCHIRESNFVRNSDKRRVENFKRHLHRSWIIVNQRVP